MSAACWKQFCFSVIGPDCVTQNENRPIKKKKNEKDLHSLVQYVRRDGSKMVKVRLRPDNVTAADDLLRHLIDH